MPADKAALRAQAQLCRAQLTAAARRQAAAALPRFLPELAAFAAARPRRRQTDNPDSQSVIALYYPIGNEIDTRPLVQALPAQGAKPALPAMIKADKMLFRLWQTGDRLERSARGFYQPPATAPACRPPLVLLPLVAFDKSGNRLGRGGGHYDRAIKAMRRQGYKPLLVGLGFSRQELPAWQAEKHDIKLHAVITEQGLRLF